MNKNYIETDNKYENVQTWATTFEGKVFPLQIKEDQTSTWNQYKPCDWLKECPVVGCDNCIFSSKAEHMARCNNRLYSWVSFKNWYNLELINMWVIK